jgi:hypothetical protein
LTGISRCLTDPAEARDGTETCPLAPPPYIVIQVRNNANSADIKGGEVRMSEGGHPGPVVSEYRDGALHRRYRCSGPKLEPLPPQAEVISKNEEHQRGKQRVWRGMAVFLPEGFPDSVRGLLEISRNIFFVSRCYEYTNDARPCSPELLPYLRKEHSSPVAAALR